MSKANVQLNGLLGKIFKGEHATSISESHGSSKIVPIDHKRLAGRTGHISLIGDFSTSRHLQLKSSFGFERLDLQKSQTALYPALTDRTTTKKTHERTDTEDSENSHSDNAQKSSVVLSHGQSTIHTSQSYVESFRQATNTATTFREEVLKRENARLRKQNQALRDELQALRKSQTSAEEDKLRQLENSIFLLTSRNRDLQRAAQYNAHEISLLKEINARQELRIECLICENQQLSNSLEGTMRQVHELSTVQIKLKAVCCQLSLLERKIEEDDSEWEQHKEMWYLEKEYYKQIIRKLEFQVRQTHPV